MKDLIRIIRRHNLPARNFLEIGSRDGNDAIEFMTQFKCRDVFVVEASKRLAEEIMAKSEDLSVHHYAVSIQNGTAEFNDMSESEGDTFRGMSSLRNRELSGPAAIKVKKETVPTIRGDTLMEILGLDFVDVCKIDVEGMAFEVLKGFGDMIRRVGCIQVEAELTQVWNGERLFSDVARLLIEEGFVMKHFIQFNHPTIQCDSIWLRKE